MKVALVYDRVNKWGGAERVLLALHKLFPQASLFTAVYNPKTALWAETFRVKPSFLNAFPFAKSSHELFAILMPLAFESFSFDEYDLVISVTSEAAKGIITKPHTKHLCYCLTPTRYLWSGYDEYFSSRFFKVIASPAVSYLRKWDQIAAQRPDQMIAISKEVQGRIKKYYSREAPVIYPPFTLNNKNNKKMKSGDFFLAVSRLVPYKRVDLVVKACNELRLPLHVVGTGTEESFLKSIAGPTITFRKNLSDRELADAYLQSKALIFPGKEDFGLVMVEALSFGKPVIAYREGGAMEIVLNKKTGLLFSSQTVSSLKQALLSFNPNSFDPEECQKTAEKFSFDSFQNNLMRIIG